MDKGQIHINHIRTGDQYQPQIILGQDPAFCPLRTKETTLGPVNWVMI